MKNLNQVDQEKNHEKYKKFRISKNEMEYKLDIVVYRNFIVVPNFVRIAVGFIGAFGNGVGWSVF